MGKPLKLVAIVAAAILVLVFFPVIHLVAFFTATLSVFYLFLLFVSDGDLTLMLYERFGRKGDHLNNKVIWITGASCGIGKQLAIHLAQKGAKLVLSSRNEKKLAEVKAECLLNYSGEETDILLIPLDVTKFELHKEVVQKIVQHFSTIDILINNAGRSQRAYVAQTILEVDQELINLNLLGPISLMKAVLPTMFDHGHGQIVNISSVAGRMGTMFSATYAATKHALHGYFDAAAMELFNKNIHITNVCPGPVISNIIENCIQKDFDQPPMKNYDGFGDRAFAYIMTGERCAELITVAMANKLGEAWISKHPPLIVCYLGHYVPQLYIMITKRLGLKRAAMIAESQKQK